MKKVENIIQAINDPQLFRPFFRDLSTWGNWLSFLRVLFGLPLDDRDLSVYKQCTARTLPPDRPFKEAWLPIGRRSGKSFIAALVAVFLACFKDYSAFTSVGEEVFTQMLHKNVKK